MKYIPLSTEKGQLIGVPVFIHLVKSGVIKTTDGGSFRFVVGSQMSEEAYVPYKILSGKKGFIPRKCIDIMWCET